MKKKKIKLLLVAMVMVLTYASQVNAQVHSIAKETKANSNSDSVLLPSWQKTAKDIKNNYLRGTIISTGIAEIANNGGGDIQISLITLAHKDCEEIRHKAYLDKWDEASETWQTIDTYNFVETKADHPDEDFTALTTTFVVLKQPTGYFYRVRAIHMATYGGRMEVISSQTDGILINKD